MCKANDITRASVLGSSTYVSFGHLGTLAGRENVLRPEQYLSLGRLCTYAASKQVSERTRVS